ncbi:tRNA 2-thiouridine(34) synthase MnmA [Patescibacteria group bacterium]|nr:tRNA 2-thiouridine(34) synthase MnmA [Patescibacteria group bacterium]
MRKLAGKHPSKKGWHWTDYFKSSPLKLNKNWPQPTIFVAMSGGVDSSVTAYLLKKAGYQVVGMFMKNWSYPIKRISDCPLYQDYLDMVAVCKALKIPYLVVSFEKEYKKRVIDDFFKGYARGQTPNPDVLCNREIKFDLFLKEAIRLGADLIATGHHIRSRYVNSKGVKITPPFLPLARGGVGGVGGHHELLMGKDPIKDQTYFVYPITQAQLKKCIFPVGEYIKDDIRKLAREANLPTAAKRDSQGICFIGRIDAKDFLKTRLPEKTGDIVDTKGNKLGEHEGAWFYTIGQRRIAGLSGTIKPLYVLRTDVKKNQVVVGSDKDTYAKVARIKNLHLISPQATPANQLLGKKLLAKPRYTPEVYKGVLKKDKRGYYFEFSSPERAITPGQSLVLYQKDVCLGGGVITSSKL